jgi:hypothetical protein
MTCAYVFSLLALASLPAVLTLAFHLHVFPSWLVTAGLIALVAWATQTYIQLVLLSIILVGGNVTAEASDARAAKTFADAEAIMDRLDLATAGGLTEVHREVRGAREDMRAIITALNAALPAGQLLKDAVKPGRHENPKRT